MNELKRIIKFFLSEIKPKGNIFTPFNLLSAPIIILGIILIVIRFIFGLSSIANISDYNPWGIWISFNVITGAAFAGGAYVLTFIVYILQAKKYYCIIRFAVLSGLLGYVFYVGALILELGRPWHMINIVHSFAGNSVLFLVGWCVMLYIIVQFLEFSPAIAEWLSLKGLRKILMYATLGSVIGGITISFVYQSSLGALFLLAKGKIHPLWYSEFIPILFFVSSIFAGLSMVIIEGGISLRVFKNQISKDYLLWNDMVFGLSKGSAIALSVYLFLKVWVLIYTKGLNLLPTVWGYWYLVEVIGFVLMPIIMYSIGLTKRNIYLLYIATIITALGIIINRLNITMIAFNYDAPLKHYPSWMEIEVAVALIFSKIWAFRFIVNRMPVLKDYS